MIAAMNNNVEQTDKQSNITRVLQIKNTPENQQCCDCLSKGNELISGKLTQFRDGMGKHNIWVFFMYQL